MRKLPAIFHRLLALVACLLLSACFDIREEVWIERNGAGRAELRYTVPESALLLSGGAAGVEKKIRDLIASQPSLILDGVSVEVRDERAIVAVNVSTKSMLSLLDLKKSDSFQNLPESTANIVGHFDVRLRWLDLDFSRSIHVREALGLASLAVGSEDREQRRLTYIVHLPKAAKESNATLITDGGKTLTWDTTLDEAMKRPLVTRFRATMPIPRYAWAAVAGALLAIAGSAVWVTRKLRRLSRRGTSSP
ncbi:hypothetical protein OKA05_24720 [Luteolibacter arcticus]|uniref:DUF3153 domain-containing protein n=1 Tax=Luteolibacter arcticus TaxID=1581411 RepID=A0ABT3GQJ7_9BACT|nr:hypothetical protein [Luteolibacter arcticus]MCW1925785.1 hypothetical protein [Luteolibacter arcticus]